MKEVEKLRKIDISPKDHPLLQISIHDYLGWRHMKSLTRIGVEDIRFRDLIPDQSSLLGEWFRFA
jgi:hypothetical protein